jgi:hypothetical protein
VNYHFPVLTAALLSLTHVCAAQTLPTQPTAPSSQPTLPTQPTPPNAQERLPSIPGADGSQYVPGPVIEQGRVQQDHRVIVPSKEQGTYDRDKGADIPH